MASREQIQTLLGALKAASPSQMLQSIDAGAAGMRAILLYLADAQENVTASRISDYMKVSTARVTVLLQKLEAKGLIEKERDPQDNRRVQVALSARGREVALQMQEQVNARVEAMIDQIGMERMLEFAALSQEIHSIFQPAEIDL